MLRVFFTYGLQNVVVNICMYMYIATKCKFGLHILIVSLLSSSQLEVSMEVALHEDLQEAVTTTATSNDADTVAPDVLNHV